MSFRTVDFLPEIFQTPINRQFLSATLDQLTQEPEFKRTQGYIGRKIGPGVNPNDKYVIELDKIRSDYQLEPGVVSLREDRTKIKDVITYPGMVDALALQGANTSRLDRLWTSEYYSWDPFVDFDKFINFSQYYWLPNGPDAVDISSSAIPLTDSFDVTRTNRGYEFSGIAGNRPTIYLLRGGSYTFNVNQDPYKFWIQLEPGVNGTLRATPNISSRDILGVEDNGQSNGTVTFNVPQADAQQFYYDLPLLGSVDLLTTTLTYEDINNVYLDNFLAAYPSGIDGITSLDQKTIIFTTEQGWFESTRFDPLPQNPAFNGQVGSFDTTLYDQELEIPFEERYKVWRIVYNYDTDNQIYLTVEPYIPIAIFDKVDILFGAQWSSTQWYKNSDGFIEKIPLLSAIFNTLYYQDSTNPNFFGVIRLLESTDNDTIFIDNILGKPNYTSPTGVVFTNNLKVVFRGSVVPDSYQNNEYYVSGVGTAIKLLPVTDYITPETYIDSTEPNQPLIPDYLLMSLDSPSLNAWSRTNRWFHIDVINATAEYNNTVAVFDNNFRAKRPILEFRGGLQLFNNGTAAKQPVDIVDFVTTDAFSEVNGATSYQVDGYEFVNGTRVIFAIDNELDIRNKIYIVSFIEPTGDSSSEVILLTPAEDANVLVNNSVLCLNGQTEQGLTYWFNGLTWKLAQEKTQVNQAPLFDVFDLNGISYSDQDLYISSNFFGSKIFSYQPGEGSKDPVLGFPLNYLTLANVGDIVFDNNFYTETFVYLKDKASETLNISNGILKEYSNRTAFVPRIGWQTAATPLQVYQQFRFVYDGSSVLLLDVAVKNQEDIDVPVIKIYIGEDFQVPGTFTFVTTENSTTITLNETGIPLGTIIEVQALSDQISEAGFYEVPNNLENNPFNENSSIFTLGTARQHYQSIAENLLDFQGSVNGANNTRDLGNILPYGLIINQQSSPLSLAGYFLRSRQFNIFAALDYNSREYEKIKAQILNLAVTNDYTNLSIPEILNDILTELGFDKTSSQPFYWSDMLPFSNVYTETVYTWTPVSVNVFDTTQTYDFTSANYLGLLVYLNGVQLLRGSQYTVGINSPTITVTAPLAVGDTITIREYQTTAGSFIPNTPTKLGLYPATEPEIYIDETYIEPTLVIRGHDGSITVAFEDFRDELLLEFEKRIYNNLKVDGNPIPLVATDVIPGQFRSTDYSIEEVDKILASDFFSWVGWNKLDFRTQNYISSNKFTYNYSQSGNKLNNTSLDIGAWRGIYNYFYDTIYPNTRPWEMLGFSVEPSWWQSQYGLPPYTSGNLVLWDDLEDGLVRDPDGEYIIEKYARPGLTQVIPAGSEGQLASPFDSVVGSYSQNSFRLNWKFGDDGPVENAWRTSSSYPFSIMRLLALTRPAEFFTLFADRDLYRFDNTFDQYLLNERYRLDANGVQVYGNGISKASYIDWIVDFNRQSGLDSTDILTEDLASLDVRLCYRFGAFTAKNLLQVFTEKSSPQSINSGLLLPDESYNLFLYKNVPFNQAIYSSVIVQKTNNGYSVYGYGTLKPYFEILASQNVGIPVAISAGGKTVNVSVSHSDTIIQIPYGFEYTTTGGVADFLISYGARLQQLGFTFGDYENGYILNWQQMVKEFLYWDAQGWGVNSIINLNPLANKLVVETPLAIVDDISVQTQENLVLDQDKSPLTTKNLIVDRENNRFSLEPTNNQTINYISVNLVSYENIMVLDNRSIFADLIYDPATGARQDRIKISAVTSVNWNGQLNAPGFILNQDNIQEWVPLRKYAKGEIVKYKNLYYSAIDIIQPSEIFNFNLWKRSDYTEIQTGLLPNLANKSNQLENSYNVYTANLERDQDLFSYGLIGFRPRQYMTALNLNDISQVNLYRQFLGTKGTVQAAEIFTFADLGKGVAQFDIYENWAVQKATYGANANRNYYEIQLNEADLGANPSTVQVIFPGQQTLANQTVQVSDIWKSSTLISNPNILTTRSNLPPDAGLPTAGFVNFNDVDITVFSLEDPTVLNPYLGELSVGQLIWVAKVNNYDWDVYRVYGVPGRVLEIRDNLDGTAQVIFDQNHNLIQNQQAIIKFFDPAVDGVYRVLAVPAPNSIVIAYIFVNINQISIFGNGVAFTLQSVRVSQPSDIINTDFADDLNLGFKIWVSNSTSPWEVLEKQEVFDEDQIIQPEVPVQDGQYGISAAQSQQNLFVLIGSPGYSASGAVYTYVKNNFSNYIPNNVLECSAVGTQDFGRSISIGNTTFSAVGAPLSDINAITNMGLVAVLEKISGASTFEFAQLLLPEQDLSDSAEFGHSVKISQDEKWLYVGAPGINAVYAFAQVAVQRQTISYRTDGSTDTFNFDDSIVIDESKPNQLVVVLNNQLLLPASYSISGGELTLNTTPADDLILNIARKSTYEFDGSGGAVYNIGDYLYTAQNIYSFNVLVDNVLQRPFIDYTFNTTTRNITFSSAKTSSNKIIVRSGSYYQYIDKLEPPTPVVGARFGHSIDCTLDGSQILIGAKNDDVVAATTTNNAGAVYIFERNIERFTVTDIDTTEYSTTVNFVQPLTVSINGQNLINTEDNIGGQFTVVDSNTVDIDYNFTVGDVIEISINSFNFLQKLSQSTPQEFSEYGYSVKICDNSCSVYVGVPGNNSELPQSGSVERTVNQARTYGTISSTIANPLLVSGDSLRINNINVIVPGLWVEANPYTFRTVVYTLSSGIYSIYQAQQDVPGGTDILDTDYWRLIDTTAFAYIINLIAFRHQVNAIVPNVSAVLSSNIQITPSGLDRTYSIGTAYQNVESYTPLVYVNNVLKTVNVDYTLNLTAKTLTFTTPPPSTADITVVTGVISFSTINETLNYLNKLNISLGLVNPNSVYDALGLEVFVHTQDIYSPRPSITARFGESISLSNSARTLIVGAPRDSAYIIDTYDNGQTYFDSKKTTFYDQPAESGAAYSFDLLDTQSPSVTNPNLFVFGQIILPNVLESLDQYGKVVNYVNNTLLITSPGSDLGDSVLSELNYGKFITFLNENSSAAWVVIRRETPVVDIRLINSVFAYDILQSAETEYFDFIDPLQNKILGVARQNIDFIGAIDPASYNVGSINNYGRRWGAAQVGKIWWDTANTRFVNPNQNNIEYAAARWSQLFPGSTVEIYQWTVSSVPPAQYTGPGVVKSLASYTVVTAVDSTGVLRTNYFFWVRGNEFIQYNAGKSLSTTSIERYIEDPKSSGIPFVAFLSSSATAIYNKFGIVNAQDTVLSIEYDKELNDNAVHVEYELIPQDRADGFLSTNLYRKLQDSFCGADTQGNIVPDPLLRPANRYGVNFRPRQSMFINRFAALQNYLTRVNEILARYPISENRNFSLLNSSEPIPSSNSGAWDDRVADLEELSFQDLSAVPVGYKYLVESNSEQFGFWTINQVTAAKTLETLQLVRVQSYDTPRYWSYINWYQPGYNSSITPVAVINYASELDSLSVPVGSSVKVRFNANNKFEIYLRTETGWVRVGLQDGTIEISRAIWDYAFGKFGFDVEVFDSQYFDQEPVIETRKIIQAINEELLVDDLLIERNRCLVLMFNFILSESLAPQWLFKTSLIDVDHRIRELLPFQIYNRDNQEFVIDYIQEVKPYHVQVRELNLLYNGFDQAGLAVNDFDLPAYFKTSLVTPKFVSPILTPYTLSTAVGTGLANLDSDTAPDSQLWSTLPYVYWFDNYKLSLESVSIVNGGTGYLIPPEVSVIGDCVTPAIITANINILGQVSEIEIIDPGSGYTSTPTIVVTGVGTGAILTANMGNQLIRQIKTTIKFDRYQHQSTITDWEPGITYISGQRVRYANRVWQATENNSSMTFNLAQWTSVSANVLSGVDRTRGYYAPTAEQFGVDLNLLMSGISYPGVQVYGLLFNDNITELDTVYESSFLDSYLGTRLSDINVVGGTFVDTYSSHAPEELVPGSIFDTLDFRVFTRPGADWQGDGHGFPLNYIRFTYNSATSTEVSFANLINDPIEIIVSNQTQQRDLILGVHYTIDWVTQTVSIVNNVSFPAASNGDIITVSVYGIGGGNQIFRQSYNGQQVGNQLTIPVLYDEIDDLVIFVNGELTTDFTYSADVVGFTVINFATTYTAVDYISITALSESYFAEGISWSTPITEYFTADGSTLSFILSADMGGINAGVAVVERNGIRARPPAGASYIADGSSAFALPTRLGFNQSTISDSDVVVWLNNELQVQGVDYIVEPYVSDEDLREVIFAVEPNDGDNIYIAVFTDADYTFSGLGTSTVTLDWNPSSSFLPLTGDIISVISWNDTQQQNLSTKVYVGPVTTGVTVNQPYDSTPFSYATISGDPGSYDYTEGITLVVNDLFLDKVYTKPERLWVTLNGDRLFYGAGFTVNGQELILTSGVISVTDVVVITEVTDSVTPDHMAFRIFQDMRGLQLTYRITENSTTELASAVLVDDDEITVKDASRLEIPSPTQNLLGVVTINGERITYREIDFNSNTISGLRRGTAGTAVAAHAADSIVYDMGIGNLLEAQYQNRLVQSTSIGDGSTIKFTADDIDLNYYADSSGFIELAVRVYVGGILQSGNYFISNYNPISVEFDTAPADGLEVVIEILQGLSWYEPGVNTASNGLALQETDTTAARFFRGF